MNPKPSNPLVAQVKVLLDSFALLKEANEADKSMAECCVMVVVHEKIKLLTIANKELTACVASLEGILYEMEVNGDEDALVDPRLREGGVGDMVEGNEGNNQEGDACRGDLEKAQRTQQAADSNVIKVSNCIISTKEAQLI